MALTIIGDTPIQKKELSKSKVVTTQSQQLSEKLSGCANVNGVIEYFEQGEDVTDCVILSELLGLSYTNIGKKIISESVKSDGMGGAIVTFKGSKSNQKEFRISVEEFNRFRKDKSYSKGDDDVLCIEIAIFKYLKTLGMNVDKRYVAEYVKELNEGKLVGLLMGDNVKMYEMSRDDLLSGDFIKEFEKHPNKFVITTGFDCHKGDEIHPGHAYALKRIEYKNNEKYVVFINPGNSTKELKMKYDDFKFDASQVEVFDLNASNPDRNMMPIRERVWEKTMHEKVESKLANCDKYQELNKKIKYANDNELKQYINSFSDTQRYIFMKNSASTIINELDYRYMGLKEENIKNKKDVIEPFINSVVKHSRLFGVDEKDIKTFKNVCDEELNAKFYTNERKIIRAFESFIKIVEDAKDKYYEKCEKYNQ